MKICINLLKLFIVLLLLSFLFTTSCDILSTYSEDEYLALGKKDKNIKDNGSSNEEENNGSNNIEIILEDYNYIINNEGTFSFDSIPISERTSEIIFRIYNNGSEPLELTGNPKVEINQITDFTVNHNVTNTTISPNNWALFIITYTSTATDGQVKTATISIPNSSEDNNPFTFTISCTAKVSNTVEFLNVGSTNWTCPVQNSVSNILLVGGGGGGGGSDADENSGSGAGGGAGEVVQTTLTLEYNQLYTIIIGNGGIGGSNDYNPLLDQGNGGNGSASQIIFNSNIILNADYGRGGQGGRDGFPYAFGGLGYPDTTGRGQNGQSPLGSDGGDGGYNTFGGSESRGVGGNGGGFIYPAESGSPSDPNTGAGGGGGGSDDEMGGSDPGGEGGHGGSGYCRIQWIGFLIP